MVSFRAGQDSIEKRAVSYCEGAEEIKFKKSMKNRVIN